MLISSRCSAMVVGAHGGADCSPVFRSSKSLQFAVDGVHTRHCRDMDELSAAQGNPLNHSSSSFLSPYPSLPPHPPFINSLPFLSIFHWLE